MKKYQYHQERTSEWNIAEDINRMQSSGWEFVSFELVTSQGNTCGVIILYRRETNSVL